MCNDSHLSFISIAVAYIFAFVSKVGLEMYENTKRSLLDNGTYRYPHVLLAVILHDVPKAFRFLLNTTVHLFGLKTSIMGLCTQYWWVQGPWSMGILKALQESMSSVS